MLEMLKSIFRVDSDYSKRRLAQKYFGIVDPDYYEWESHILFDDSHKLEVNSNSFICQVSASQFTLPGHQ